MQKRLSALDVKILDALGKYGPRNMSLIARKLGIARHTLLFRIKRMKSHIFLRFHGCIYHTNLGLKKVLVLAEATSGYENLLLNALKANGYWIYVGRYYGQHEGVFAVYTIPKAHDQDFVRFLEEIKKLRIAKGFKLYWSTCFQEGHVTCKWFDFRRENWDFKWDEWVKEIPKQGTDLPFTLKDPKDFVNRADYIDIMILKELEKDATISFTDLAEVVGTTPQNVKYHFVNHVIKYKMLEGYQVFTFPFDPKNSDMFIFICDFPNNAALARFALSLLDKPFVLFLGKILKHEQLIVHVYISRQEFRNFVDALSTLTRKKILKNFFYVIEDLRKNRWFHQTLSYEFFENGKWIYDHEGHVSNLCVAVKSHLQEDY